MLIGAGDPLSTSLVLYLYADLSTLHMLVYDNLGNELYLEETSLQRIENCNFRIAFSFYFSGDLSLYLYKFPRGFPGALIFPETF